MGIAKVRVLGLELGQQALGGVKLAQVAAQNGIDEPCLGIVAALSGQLNGLVNGGMSGDAIEPKDLVKTQAQEVLQYGLLRASVCLAIDQPIQRRLPADDAIDQFLAEVAVGGR